MNKEELSASTEYLVGPPATSARSRSQGKHALVAFNTSGTRENRQAMSQTLANARRIGGVYQSAQGICMVISQQLGMMALVAADVIEGEILCPA